MLQDILKPLTTSMKLFGIYHLRSSTKIEPSKTEVWQTKLKGTMKRIYSLGTYSFAVMILIWANLLRYIPGMKPYDPQFNLRIILLIWFILVALISATMFVASGSSCQLQLFYKHWNTVLDGAGGIFKDLKLARSVIIGTVVSWVIVLIDLTGIIVLFFLEDTDLKKEAIRPFPNNNLVIGAVCVVTILAGGITAFTISFVIILCHIIKASFNELSNYLKQQIKNSGERIPRCLKECRRLHVDLCECVAILDRTFGTLIAVFLGVNLPLACFILYQFVNYTVSVIMLPVCVVWLVSSVFTMLVVTVSAALLHEAAHSPTDHIFKLRSIGANINESIEVSLFVGQLTGRCVGFTVLGMFVVTKEVLLTIAGLFMTYFFLLLQFRIG